MWVLFRTFFCTFCQFKFGQFSIVLDTFWYPIFSQFLIVFGQFWIVFENEQYWTSRTNLSANRYTNGVTTVSFLGCSKRACIYRHTPVQWHTTGLRGQTCPQTNAEIPENFLLHHNTKPRLDSADNLVRKPKRTQRKYSVLPSRCEPCIHIPLYAN